jgi:hypothetical protein
MVSEASFLVILPFSASLSTNSAFVMSTPPLN